MSTQEFIPCLLYSSSLFARVFVSRNYPESDLQGGVKLWRALSLFGLGRSKDSEARNFRRAQSCGLVPPASGPRVLKASRNHTPNVPSFKVCWERADSSTGAPARRPFPQTGKTEAESGQAVRVLSATLVSPAPPGRCGPWAQPRPALGPTGGGVSPGAHEGLATSLASPDPLAPLVSFSYVASMSGPVPGVQPLPQGRPPAWASRSRQLPGLVRYWTDWEN